MDIPKKKGGRPSKMPDERMLAMLYETETATDIARRYKVPVNTVYSWIRRSRIKNKAPASEQG